MLYLKDLWKQPGYRGYLKTRSDCQICRILVTLPKLDVYTGISNIDLRPDR
jgi:hypothetical protein